MDVEMLERALPGLAGDSLAATTEGKSLQSPISIPPKSEFLMRKPLLSSSQLSLQKSQKESDCAVTHTIRVTLNLRYPIEQHEDRRQRLHLDELFH
jgi:hypothetical protein